MNNDEERLVGWVICRLRSDFDENDGLKKVSSSSDEQQSLSKFVMDLVYGNLSNDNFPPADDWVFLATETKLTIVAHGFTSDEITAAASNPITVQRFRKANDAYGKQQDIDSIICGCTVSNCPISEMNGTYFEQGSHDGVPMYIHVRKWCIVRLELPELPELGISAADTYRFKHEGGNSAFFFRKAETSFLDIVGSSSTNKEGSSAFTRKFIDLVRAGSKLVTTDQTLYALHENNRRSVIQSKNSSLLLERINTSKNELDTHTMSTEPTKPYNMSKQPSTHDMPMTKQKSTAEMQPPPISTININSSNMMGDDQVVAEMVLSREVTFFQENTHQAPITKEWQTDAEAELQREVLTAIEIREEILHSFLLLAHETELKFLENAVNNEEIAKEKLVEALQKLRNATLDYLDVYNAWCRVRHVKSTQRMKTTTDKKSRSFAVIIAYHSTSDLYPASEAMHSNIKCYSRNRETAVKKVELSFIGDFPTRETAVEALENAMNNIPQEQWLVEDIQAVSKAIVTFRTCQQHYLVRTHGVNPQIPCELCQIRNKINSNKLKQKDVFLYKTVDYNERMVKDLATMKGLQFMQRMFTSLQWENNPLVLDTSFVDFVLNNKSQGKTYKNQSQQQQPLRSKTSELNTTNSSHRGKIEFLHEAIDFSRTYRETNRTREKNKKYETSPFNVNMMLSSSSVSSLLHSKGRGGGVSYEEGREMMTVPFPPELGKRIKNAMVELYDRYTFFHDATGSAAASSSGDGQQQQQRPFSASGLNKTNNDFNKTASSTSLQRSQAFAATATIDISKEMEVEAFYSDHGASITHTQTRLLPAHRESDIWCRTDIGEFAGLITTKGRNMRSYEFQEALVAEGKRKEKYRKLLQTKLRAVLDIHPVDVRVDSIYELIAEAKAVRGSTLSLDIKQVENFIKWYFQLIFYITKAQSIYRANKTRVYYRALKNQEHVRKLRRRLLCNLVDIEAKQLVSTWLTNAVQREVKRKIFGLKVSCVVNLSGNLAIATVIPANRSFRKFASHQRLCLGCKHNEAKLHYNIATGTYSRQTMPCTCNMIQEEESWAISFYIPLTGQTFRKKVAMTEIKHVILQFEAARLQFHQTKWLLDNPDIDSSFLQLFSTLLPPELVQQRLEKEGKNAKFFPSSFSQAMLQSGKESMTPLRYPRMLLPSIDAILTAVADKGSLHELRTKLDLVPRSYQQSMILSNYHHIPLADTPDSSSKQNQQVSWEPFVEIDFATRDLQQVHHDIDLTKARLICTIHDLQLKEQELTNKTLAFELTNMQFEDQYSRIQETQSQLIEQGKLNLQVMQTTKHYYDEITTFENQEKLDLEVLLSRPQVESSSTWKNMHFYNKFHKQLIDEITTLNELFVTLQTKKLEFYQALPQKIDIMKKIKNHELQLTQIQMTILGFENRLRRSKENLFNAVRHYCQAWSMPRRLPCHNHLVTTATVVDLDAEELVEKQLAEKAEEEAKHVATSSHVVKKHRRKSISHNPPNHHKQPQHQQCKQAALSSEALPPQEQQVIVTHERSSSGQGQRQGQGQGQRILQQILPYSLLLTRDAKTRLDTNHRLLLSGVLRQVVRIQYDQLCQRVVSIESKYLELFIRSQVAVFFDDVHKTIIIHLDGQDNDAAEAVQHEDFGYENSGVFTTMAQFAQRRDIVLTRDEALMLRQQPIVFANAAGSTAAADDLTVQSDGSNPSQSTKFKLLLPSERPRSTAHIKVISNKHSSNNSSSTDTYQKRLVNREKQDFELAQSLVSQLRLQPFTARPCLGKLHFIRRQKMTFDHVTKSAWYNDLMSSHIPNNLHLLTSKTIFMLSGQVNKSRVMMTVKEFFYRFEVSLTYKHVNKTLPVVAKLELNVNALFDQLLSLHQPIGILHLLGMIWVNEYNAEVISPLLQKSTLQLKTTGQLTNQFYRSLLANEIPVVTRLKDVRSGYKRLHSEHRFVGGLYADAWMNVNEAGDVRLEIRRAWDGKFNRHCYTGSESLVVSLSMEAVRLLLLQAGNNKLSLLHAKEVYKLFHFLWDCLDPSIFSPSALQASGVVKVTTGMSCDIAKLKSFAETFMAQHHDWIHKRYPHKQRLLDVTKDTEHELLAQLETLSSAPKWKFNVLNPISPKVKVYERLFGFGHTLEDRPFEAIQASMVIASKAADHIICQATTSTDANKSQLWIQLSPLSLQTQVCPSQEEENLLLSVERSMFQLEDTHSEQRRKMEFEHQHLQARQHEFKEASRIAKEKKQLLPLQTLQKGFTSHNADEERSSSLVIHAADLVSLLFLHHTSSKDTPPLQTENIRDLGVEQIFTCEKASSTKELVHPRLPALPHRDELRAPTAWLRSTLLKTPQYQSFYRQNLNKLVVIGQESFLLQSVYFDHDYQALVFDVVNLDSCREFQLYILPTQPSFTAVTDKKEHSRLLWQLIQSTLVSPIESQQINDEILQLRKLAQQQHKLDHIHDDKLEFISNKTICSVRGKRSVSLYSCKPRVVKKENPSLQALAKEKEEQEKKEKEAKEIKESLKKDMRQMMSKSKSRRSFNNNPGGGAANTAMLEAIAKANAATMTPSPVVKDVKTLHNNSNQADTKAAGKVKTTESQVILFLLPQDSTQRYQTHSSELHLIRQTAATTLTTFTTSRYDFESDMAMQRIMIGHVVIFFFASKNQKNSNSPINERLVEVLKLTNNGSASSFNSDQQLQQFLQSNVVILLRHKLDQPPVIQLLDDHFARLGPMLQDQRRRAGQEKQFQQRRQLLLQHLSLSLAQELQFEVEDWMTGKARKKLRIIDAGLEEEDEVEGGIWPHRKKLIALQLITQTSTLLAQQSSEGISTMLSMLNSNGEEDSALELFASQAQAEDAELLPALEHQPEAGQEEKHSQLKLPKNWLVTELETLLQSNGNQSEVIQQDQNYELKAIAKLMSRLLSPLHILATTLFAHYQSCTLPLALCPLPACRWIRNESRLLLQQGEDDSDDFSSAASMMQAVKHYFCQFCNQQKGSLLQQLPTQTQFFLASNKIIQPQLTLQRDVLVDKSIDQREIERRLEAKRLARGWQETRFYNELFLKLSPFLLSSEVRQLCGGDERLSMLLQAKGGRLAATQLKRLQALLDQALHNELPFSLPSFLQLTSVPTVAVGVGSRGASALLRRSKTQKRVTSASQKSKNEDAASKEQDQTLAEGSLSMDFIIPLLMYHHDEIVDVYPADDKRSISSINVFKHQQHPMDKDTFHRLISRIRISPLTSPESSNNSSEDNGLAAHGMLMKRDNEDNKALLSFDRLLCEGIISLALDQSLVVVQILYGTMRSNQTEDDSDISSVRFVPQTFWSQLQPGLLIFMYDCRSMVSKTIVLELLLGRSAVQEANELFESLSKRLRLSRIGDYCITATLQNQQQPPGMNNNDINDELSTSIMSLSSHGSMTIKSIAEYKGKGRYIMGSMTAQRMQRIANLVGKVDAK